jgi:pyridinium-3,5-bisthiocarboxylic acid mononucleotide nickel chelatase
LRTLHFDCFNGISGDMVLGALLDLGVPAEILTGAIGSLGLPITLEIEKTKRSGIACTSVTVVAQDQEDYRFLPDVQALIARSSLTAKQQALANRIFQKLAEAEAAVHGMPVEKVHFHEVGALDSIADILGAAVGLDYLGVEKFTSSSVPTGHGSVKCAHGIMPIPAPATANLLRGVPLANVDVKGELTTPTGAAILTSVVSEFTDSPAMRIDKIGIGCGSKDFLTRPNILRIFVGDDGASSTSDTVVVLETNLDDVPGEVIGYTTERLFAAGALDVFTLPIQMKKQRPGVLLSVIAEPSSVPKLEVIIFQETGTFGIRRSVMQRSILSRELITVPTPWGPVRVKIGTRGDWQIRTPEYEDCARIAREHGVPLREVYDAIECRKSGSNNL